MAPRVVRRVDSRGRSYWVDPSTGRRAPKPKPQKPKAKRIPVTEVAGLTRVFRGKYWVWLETGKRAPKPQWFEVRSDSRGLPRDDKGRPVPRSAIRTVAGHPTIKRLTKPPPRKKKPKKPRKPRKRRIKHKPGRIPDFDSLLRPKPGVPPPPIFTVSELAKASEMGLTHIIQWAHLLSGRDPLSYTSREQKVWDLAWELWHTLEPLERPAPMPRAKVADPVTYKPYEKMTHGFNDDLQMRWGDRYHRPVDPRLLRRILGKWIGRMASKATQEITETNFGQYGIVFVLPDYLKRHQKQALSRLVAGLPVELAFKDPATQRASLYVKMKTLGHYAPTLGIQEMREGMNNEEKLRAIARLSAGIEAMWPDAEPEWSMYFESDVGVFDKTS